GGWGVGERHNHHTAGLQLINMFGDRIRRRNARLLRIEREDVTIDSVVKIREAPERLQVRAEDKASIRPPVVQRFLAEAIARKIQPPFDSVPCRYREHAD